MDRSLVHLQCCVGVWRTAKQFRSVYIYVFLFFFSDSFLSYYRILSVVPRRSLLVMCWKCDLKISIPFFLKLIRKCPAWCCPSASAVPWSGSCLSSFSHSVCHILTSEGERRAGAVLRKHMHMYVCIIVDLRCSVHFFFLFSFSFFCLFRAEPEAYGSSQARGRIGATATSLHPSQSNMGSLTH